MENSWDIFNKLTNSNNNKDSLEDETLQKDELSNNLLKECYKLLKETKELQLDLLNSIDLLKSKEADVIVSKDKNYSQHLRESNRAWRLYGNHHKPILPIIYTGLYSGINNDFLTNVNNSDNIDDSDNSNNIDKHTTLEKSPKNEVDI